MAFPTDSQSATSLAVLIPEQFGGEAINDFFRSKLVAANHFWDVSSLVSGGGDTINIPNLTQMTANDKVNATAVTLNGDTETQIVLAINTWKEVSFMIEKKQARQVLQSYDLQEKYAQNAAYTAARSLDTALLTLYSGLSKTVGSTTLALTDAVILEGIAYVMGSDTPKDELAFFFNSNQIYGELLLLDKYVNFDFTTTRPVDGGGLAAASGMAGRLYGIPVFETNNLVVTTTVNHGLLAHKDAFVWASNGGVDLESNYIPEYLGTLTTADIIFGVKENRDTAAVHIQSVV